MKKSAKRYMAMRKRRYEAGMTEEGAAPQGQTVAQVRATWDQTKYPAVYGSHG